MRDGIQPGPHLAAHTPAGTSAPPAGPQFAPPQFAPPQFAPPQFTPPQFAPQDPFAAPHWSQPPVGRPPAGRRGRWWALALLFAVLLGGAGLVVDRTVANPAASGARAAATSYLTALERGDTAAAYATWCAEDRAQYPQAVFRAQHEWRNGRAVHVTGTRTDPFGSVHTASVGYDLGGEGSMRPLAMRRTTEGWRVCPQGARLQTDMQNCGCMSPTQQLEADIARVMGNDHDLVQVSCPPQPVLVDGMPVACTGTDAAGRTWRLTATESAGGSYTRVAVSPAR